MRTHLLVVAMCALTGCGASVQPTPTAPPQVPAAQDEVAARAAWDAAMKLRFAGDTLGSDRALVELAARHPDTRYGRAAVSGSGAGLFAVGLAGVGAAVAVPAFKNYQLRGQTAEARGQLALMEQALVDYAERECARLGKACAKRLELPASTPLTPELSVCAVGATEQTSGTEAWNAPGWRALGVAVTTPSRFQYQLESMGRGAGARIVLRAVGDMDCDGAQTTFERSGVVTADGRLEMAPPVEAIEPIE